MNSIKARENGPLERSSAARGFQYREFIAAPPNEKTSEKTSMAKIPLKPI